VDLDDWSPWYAWKPEIWKLDLEAGPGTWKPIRMHIVQHFCVGLFQLPYCRRLAPKSTGHDVYSTALQWQSDHSGHIVEPLPSSLFRSAFMLVSIPKGKLDVSVCWRAALSASR
jgi:hypothetical protein